jgi:GMP synthase (glutamine-hydrolysing)
MTSPGLYTNKIAIIDFGSQYTQLIARKIREEGIYSEILSPNVSSNYILQPEVKGIVLSGGPSSVFEKSAPKCAEEIIYSGKPILGICYGMQLMAHMLGGKVIRAEKREYGLTRIKITKARGFFHDFQQGSELNVWMSHWDQVIELPDGFEVLASSENTEIAAMANHTKNLYAVQFHPEVHHTERGRDIIRNFIFKICGASATWSLSSFLEQTIREIKEKVGNSGVICALSGGVDSTVTAVLVHRAVGENLKCIFVNNGLLRENEAEDVLRIYKEDLKLPVIYVDATKNFLNKLKGVVHPEKKRKIIGNEFIRVFENTVKRDNLKNINFLAQGTLYPDVIESVSFKGPSKKIKTHHNVGGLPKRLKFKLIEPLRELFKDEVRRLGVELKIPDVILKRHPFPGPGLAVRIIGEVTPERLALLRRVDKIVIEELESSGIYNELWQGFAVLLPLKSVGVMGDRRTYANVVALRLVNSQDGMTANWALVPYDILGRISSRIVNEVNGVNRVVYDISNKPPGTIEWE